jgi:hypothetical protein
MNSTSSANSSVSTAAIIGGGGGSVNNVVLDDFHFPSDLISIQDRKDEAMLGLFCSPSSISILKYEICPSGVL